MINPLQTIKLLNKWPKRQTDRTDRQTDRQTCTDRQTDRQTCTDRQIDRQTDTQTHDRQTNRQADRVYNRGI